MPTPAQPSPSASVPRSEELRIALVLNGGVSLAVWMGGVVFELNRLVRETHPVYRGLLELTGSAARIDVISGTSAGGVNGAALALAQLHDRSLYGLRDVWLDTGGLDKLLHDPDDAELTSLLRGDEWFLPQIRRAFEELAQGPRAPAATLPVVLHLTTTLLDGLPHTGMDDFGAVVEDTVHRAGWRFAHLEGEDDAFADARIVEQLALAARSTASFPVAFAPALYQPAGKAFEQVSRLRARTSPARPIVDERFLLDGGILDNKPFDAALEAIARLPAEGNTRRVLAYVVPDPAAAAEQRPRGPDNKLAPPTLAQAAWRSLVTIPGSQSIASHMSELRAHNDGAARRWRRLVGAIVHMGAPALQTCATASLQAYQVRRIDGIVEYLLEETERRLAAPRDAPGAAGTGMGMRRATRQWLATTWRDSGRSAMGAREDAGTDASALPDLWRARIPARFAPHEPLLQQPHWPWGLYALEFMTDFARELLRRTQRLQGLTQGGRDAADPPLPALGEAGARMHDDLALDRHASEAQRALRQGRSRLEAADMPLRKLWRTAYVLAACVQARRRAADASVGQVGGEGFGALVQAWTLRGGEMPPHDAAERLLTELLSVGQERLTSNKRIARIVCRLLLRLRPTIDAVLAAHAAPAGRADVQEAVAELRATHAFLYLPDPQEVERKGDRWQALDRIAWRVLSLEVFEVTAGSRRQAPSTQAEVVQISARLQSAFGGSANPSDKLAGMQLAHFGAFYKRSWRANDWTFGRLDGIDRALRIALNPDALQRRYGARQMSAGSGPAVPPSRYVFEYLRRLAVDAAEPAVNRYLDEMWTQEAPAIADELRWLDQPATVPPPVLQVCARALTRRLQLEALRRELPEIAHSLLQEREGGALPSPAAGAALIARLAPQGRVHPPDPAAAVQLVRSNLLGPETLAMQVGTDLLTRTASQGLATAHAALASRHGGLDAINVLFKFSEWPVKVLYWLASRLAQNSSTSAALEAAALGVGGALVVAGGLSEKLPAAALALGWALLAGAVGTALLRSLKWGAVLAVLLAVGLLLLEKVSLWVVVAVAAAGAAILQPWGSVPAMMLIVALAAWWSAGGSTEGATLLWQQINPWGAGVVRPHPMPEVEAAKWAAADRLHAVLWPALAIAVLVAVNGAWRWLAAKFRRSSALADRFRRWRNRA